MRQHIKSAANVLREARWLTRDCLLRCGAFCAFVTLGMVALDVASHPLPGLTDAIGVHAGRDFIGFWSNALLAAAGRPEAAYVVGPHRVVDQALPYPPIVLMLCWPLAGLSYGHALLVWGGVGLALCVWSLSRLVGWEMAVFAALGAPAAFINIFIEQNGYYTAVLLAWGLMLVDRRPVVAGMLLGMLCYKPHFGILVPVALLAGRHWQAVAAAAATVLALVALSVILLGPDTWIGFFDRLPLQGQVLEFRAAAWSWMPSVFAMMRLLGASSPAAYLVQGISAIGAAAAVAVLWHGRCPLGVKSAGLVIATFLATPYAWDYDLVVLVFAAAWLGNEGTKTGFRPWERIAAFVLLTLPALSLPAAELLDLQIAPILMWLALAAVMRRGLDLRFPAPLALIRARAPQSTV